MCKKKSKGLARQHKYNTFCYIIFMTFIWNSLQTQISSNLQQQISVSILFFFNYPHKLISIKVSAYKKLVLFFKYIVNIVQMFHNIYQLICTRHTIYLSVQEITLCSFCYVLVTFSYLNYLCFVFSLKDFPKI